MTSEKTDDWRSQCPGVQEVVAEARNKNILTDIQFVIGKGTSKKTFDAHKLILAFASPVFEKMFYGELAETKNPIVIEDDDPEAFNLLLGYIYGKGSDVNMNSVLCAWKCYTIGDKYLVAGIQNYVKNYLQKMSMDEKTFWEIIENDFISFLNLENKMKFYLAYNTRKILQSDKFLSVPETVVKIVLKMDRLTTSEYELLLIVTKWAYFTYGPGADSRHLLPLLQYIRFSTLTSQQFCVFIDSFPNAIDLQSSLEILKHLTEKSYKLPDWCSKDCESRSDIVIVQQPTITEVHFGMDEVTFGTPHTTHGYLHVL